MAKISVIIPVYNVEKYIHKCVDSVIGQTMQDIEIILVDDGTKDCCGEICDEYAEKDSRIKVVHKENGGLSDARNAGMKYATGECVVFVDSDDYIKNDMLEYMYKNLLEYDADFSTCGVYDVYGDHIIEQESMPVKLVSGEEAFSYILQGTHIKGAIWNKMFRRSLIEELEFPVGKTYEDVFYTCELMKKVKKVAVGTEPKYYYIHRENSITTRPYSLRDHDIIEGYTKTFKIVMEHFPNLKQEAQFRFFWSWFVVLDKMLTEKKYNEITQFKKIRSDLRKNVWKIVRNPYFQKSRKIAAIVLKFNTKLYRLLMLLNQKKNLRLMK